MNLNEKLQAVSKFSNGIFVSSQVTKDRKETDLLQKKRKLKKDFFEELYRSSSLKDAPIVLRLTQDFCNNNAPGFFVDEPKDKLEVLRCILWSGFILDWQFHIACPKGTFEFNGTALRLDTFSESVFDMKGKKVVTLPFREELLKSSEFNPIVPQSLTGWRQKSCYWNFMSQIGSQDSLIFWESKEFFQILAIG